MADKDLPRDVEAALEVLPAEERERLHRQGSLRPARDLMELGFDSRRAEASPSS